MSRALHIKRSVARFAIGFSGVAAPVSATLRRAQQGQAENVTPTMSLKQMEVRFRKLEYVAHQYRRRAKAAEGQLASRQAAPELVLDTQSTVAIAPAPKSSAAIGSPGKAMLYQVLSPNPDVPVSSGEHDWAASVEPGSVEELDLLLTRIELQALEARRAKGRRHTGWVKPSERSGST